MKLNPFERMLVNNPLRLAALRATIGWLHDAARAPICSRVLEIGCGQGDGIREIFRRFRPASVDAFDLDEQQVERARARVRTLGGAALRLWVGDAEQIEAADGTYDAVFEFTIFHHVPDWRKALAETRRVLQPGGLFLFEELSTEFFSDIPLLSPALRRFTEHPWDTMFDFVTFRRAFDDAGLRLTALRSNTWVPGHHFGVATPV